MAQKFPGTDGGMGDNMGKTSEPYKAEGPPPGYNRKTIAENIRGVAKTTTQLIKGGSVTAEQEYQRMRICKSCELFDVPSKKCWACGCYMPMKAKVKLAQCPKGKWPKLDSMTGRPIKKPGTKL